MARKKKSSMEKSEMKEKTVKNKDVEAVSFSTSDFKVKAVTVGSVDVSTVTGRTDIGKSRNYTAYVNTTVTEVSATVSAVLDSVVTSSGNTLEITSTFPVEITASSLANSVPTEVLSTLSCGGTGVSACGVTDSGILSLVAPASALRPLSLSIDVSGGGYTFVDDGSGALSDSVSGTGTIDYTTGAWALTASEVLTNGTVLSADYQVTYLWKETATPVVIKHTVGSDAPGTGTASGVVSAVGIDPAGIATYTSSTFTLSTDDTPNDNPWKGRGALPGETTLETTGRFMIEGVI